MAAGGNRLVAIGRLGVAFFATAAVALGSALPASAQDPAPAPATTTPAETTPAAPTAATEATEPESPTPEPAAAPKEPAPPADAQPAGGAAESATPAPTAPAPESAPAESTPAQSTPVASEPAAALGPVVKLEPEAPTSTLTAPLAAPTTQNNTTHSSNYTTHTHNSSSRHVSAPGADRRTTAVGHRSGELRRRNRADGSHRQPQGTGRGRPDLVAPRPRRGRRDGPRHPRVERPRQAARPADLRPTDSTRATLAGLQAGARHRGSSRHTHLVAQPGGAGSNRPGGGPGDDPEGRSTSAPGVQGRQEAHGGEGTTNRPLRPFRPGDRQRRLQRRDRNDVVFASVRARSSAVEGAAAVPIRPLARAEHASAWRDRRSSHCSTGIALHDFSTRRPGWEDPRPVVSRV